MHYTIQPATTEDDMDFFFAIEYQFSKENGMIDDKVTYEEFKEDLKSFLAKKQKTGIFVVKHESGALIGHIWISNRGSSEPWDFASDPAWIFDIHVDKEFRKRGIGKELIRQAELWAKKTGFEKLGLHVFGHNENAINMYMSTGFCDINYYTQKTIKQVKNDKKGVSGVKIRKITNANDERNIMNLVRLQFQEVALAHQEVQEEELLTKFQSLKKEIKPEHITYVAEDDKKTFQGFFWAYESKGDLGEKSYVWLLDIGVIPNVNKEGIISDLLQRLEIETLKLELNIIRTGIHCFNKKKALLFEKNGYKISNHFMYKSL